LPGTPVSQPSTAPVYSPPGSTTSTPPPESEGSVTFR
jgi:hypothetical protein